MKWISVKERLPEEFECVIFSLADGTVTVGHRSRAKGNWFDVDGDVVNVTHWMPLPDPV